MDDNENNFGKAKIEEQMIVKPKLKIKMGSFAMKRRGSSMNEHI